MARALLLLSRPCGLGRTTAVHAGVAPRVESVPALGGSSVVYRTLLGITELVWSARLHEAEVPQDPGDLEVGVLVVRGVAAEAGAA